MLKIKLLSLVFFLGLIAGFIEISTGDFYDFYSSQKIDLQKKLAEIEAESSQSWKTIYLTRALSSYEQLEALERAIYEKAIKNSDNDLLSKLSKAKKDFEIDKRLITLQYLLESNEYNQVLSNKLREKINNL